MKSLRNAANFNLKCQALLAILSLFFAHGAWATDPIKVNEDFVEYTIPGTPPPQYDVTAFDNKSIFTINFNTYNPTTPFYETQHTLFYTNSGTYIANSPLGTSSLTLLGFGNQNFGCGYNFDYSTGHRWADTFYNSGTIRCVSTIDNNNLSFLLNGTALYLLTSYGEVLVSATNIINEGTVDVSVNGLIKFTGNNVNLSKAQLIVEPTLNFFGTFGAINLSSVGAVGTDTNGDWNPGLFLTPTSALSSFVPIPPFYLQLTNSQSYLDIKSPSPDHNIYRYVFVQNDSVDIPYNVYIDDPNTGTLGFQPGAAHVEWVATYTDPATGSAVNKYLYLTDDYALGASTNDLIINGVPINFTFATSPTPLLSGPIAQSFAPLPDGYISNNFACFFGNLVGSTVGTNVSAYNPHGTITNLPGKVYITASNVLDLAFTTISGLNYLALNATNQFNGSPGAAIAAPYSDIALGVTNGFLTVSNLLMADLPTFGGTIQAWSTDLIYVDTTVTPNVTNEYKIMLVYSKLTPTTAPWIQNLYLRGSNSLVISDHLNVYKSLYSDARSVTLNTNEAGVGATSLDGRLTWLNNLPLNANSGSGVQQFPNLLWLTNNGAIRVLHNATFGNPAVPQYVVTPGVPAVAATGKLAKAGTNAVLNDKVTIGTNQYTFVNTLVNSNANQVKWTTTADGSLSNLIAAINGAAGGGTKYSTATKSNKFVSAGPLVNHAFTVTSRTNGTIGNTIITLFTPATASSNLTWSGLVTLTNGVDAIPPFTNFTSFVNHGFIDDEGTAIWTTYFEHTGEITNGSGSFVLHGGMGVLTNCSIFAGGDVILVTTNSPATGVDGLLLSNVVIKAGHKLTLWTTNLLGDSVTNGNQFVVGEASGGGTVDSGFNIPIKPPLGDLLGTTVTNIAPVNKTIYNVWSGHDYGRTTLGYTNNLAVGHLILDAIATNKFGPVAFNFTGAGVSNALYIDLLELKDGAGFGNNTNAFNFPWLKINTNMFVYYAQALINGVSVAEAIDNQSKLGANGGRLRWIYSYAGYLSSTNIIYPDGSSNLVNTALAQSSTIDSDGDGIPNSTDPTPFFVQTNMNLTVVLTNVPPQSARIQWSTVPNATNFIFYSTNMITTNCWHPFTNFQNWYYGNNVAVTNSAHSNYFKSPQIYINNASLPDNSQQTNVWVLDPLTNGTHYYKVLINPWLNYPN